MTAETRHPAVVRLTATAGTLLAAAAFLVAGIPVGGGFFLGVALAQEATQVTCSTTAPEGWPAPAGPGAAPSGPSQIRPSAVQGPVPQDGNGKAAAGTGTSAGRATGGADGDGIPPGVQVFPFAGQTQYCTRSVGVLAVQGTGNVDGVSNEKSSGDGGGVGWVWLPVLLLVGVAGGFAAARHLVGGSARGSAGGVAHVPAGAGSTFTTAVGASWRDEDYLGAAVGRKAEPGFRAVPPPPVEPAVARAAKERDALVRACIDLSDHLQGRDTGLWNRLRGNLSAIGVDSVVPDGEPFDPHRFDATGYEPATDPKMHMRVASTSFAGFVDHGRELRRPAVVVYRAHTGSAR